MNKSFLREKYKQKRQELSKEELENFSVLIKNRITSSFKFEGKLVSIFLPIKRLNEINTYPLIEALKVIEGTKVCTPVSDFQTLTLKHILFDENSVVKNNKWGIPEPQNGVEVDVKGIDVVFVPLLAVDVYGDRVGYGKGFYDRFLSSCSSKTIFIGLHFFGLEKEIIDTNPMDIKLHYVATPNKLIKCERK